MPLTSPQTHQKLLSVAEVAHLAGVSDFTIYTWIRHRQIPCYETNNGIGLSPLIVAVELFSTGLPLLPLDDAVEATGGDLTQAYQLDKLGRIAKIRLPNGNTYYTTFGVAKALGIQNAAYIGSAEVAAKLGISRTTVNRRVKEGHLPAVRLIGGGRQVIPANAVTPINTAGWIRVVQVAAMWGMNQASINRMCRRGDLDAILIGGRHGFYVINPDCVGHPPEDLISTREFAEMLGITPRGVRYLYRQDKMPGWRLGHIWRWSKADALRLQEERAQNRA